jgi:PBP1b-binding outer membrane lipoprotein LpoB
MITRAFLIVAITIIFINGCSTNNDNQTKAQEVQQISTLEPPSSDIETPPVPEID